MTSSFVPQWEWRTFDGDLSGLEACLGPAEQVANTHDVYLISEQSDANVKVTVQGLEIRLLRRIDRGLELWMSVLTASFPLGTATLERLWSAAGTQPTRPVTGASSRDELLEAMRRVAPSIHVVPVEETRRFTDIGDCRVEVAALRIGSQTFRTGAVQSESADHVLHTLQMFAIDTAGNENLVWGLKRLLGIHAASGMTCGLSRRAW